MKHTIITILICLFAIQIQAQSIVNAAGNTTTIGGHTYSYSVGEMCAVHTASTASIAVTHGLLQPIAQIPNGLNVVWLESDKINLYPNPSSSILYLEMQTNESATGQITLIDMSGKQVLKRQKIFNIGFNKVEFDLTPFANAQYVLQIHLNKSNQRYSQSYNIQKIK